MQGLLTAGLVVACRHGCFFEVKRDGELCWCYLNPVVGTAEDSQQLKVVPQGSVMATYDDNDGRSSSCYAQSPE